MNNETNNEPQKRDFKGVWIPKNIWLNTELSWMEKLFIVEIDSLDNENHCFARNSYFAKFFQISKPRCTQIIKSLEEKGYLKIYLERSGKQILKRILIVNRDKYSKEPIKNSKQGIKNTKSNIIIQDNNTSNNISGNAIFSNNFNKFDNEQENEYIDFRPLAKEGKIGLLGKAKAICQDKLSYLTFDNFDNKKLSDILGSIKANLNAYNKQNNITARVTDESVLKAFKTALNSILNKSEETPSLAYVKSCLTPSLYLDNQSKETGKDYSQFLNVVKSKFKHYQKFTPQDIRDLERIIEALKEKGGSDLENFKELFNNLPQWVLDKRYYQSIAFVAKKIDELKQVYSLDELARQNENFNALKEWKGEEEALRLIKKVLLKNASNS